VSLLENGENGETRNGEKREKAKWEMAKWEAVIRVATL
jgi:hypothetical protein